MKGVLVVALLLTGAGCQGVYTQSALTAVHDARVTGEWQVEGESDTFGVRPDGDDYIAEPPKEKNEKPVRFRLVRIGEALYAQAAQKPCEDFAGEAECHSLARLELTPDAAQLFTFDTDAMFTASLANNLGISYELRRRVRVVSPPESLRAQTDFLLSGEEPEIRAFLAAYGPKFTVSKPLRYRRRKAQF